MVFGDVHVKIQRPELVDYCVHMIVMRGYRFGHKVFLIILKRPKTFKQMMEVFRKFLYRKNFYVFSCIPNAKSPIHCPPKLYDEVDNQKIIVNDMGFTQALCSSEYNHY